MNTLVDERPRARRIPWRSLLMLAGCALIIWLVHPPVLSWILRLAAERVASQAGLQLEVGEIRARLSQPIVFERVRVRATNADESQTAVDAARVELALVPLWSILFDESRVFRSVILQDVRAVLDLRRGDNRQRILVRQANEREQRSQRQRMLRYLPEYVAVQRANLEFLATGQSYFFEDVSADFSEERLGEFRAVGAELRAGPVNQSLGSLKGITAWKDGTIYFASVDLWEGVKLESLEVQLAQPGGVSVGVQATLFGGSLRFDVSSNSEQGRMAVNSAVSASNIEIVPLAALLGYHGDLEGVIRDVKFTFRGLPERALDGQGSLRLAADGFRLNKRGWESLELGARMIHRRVAVSELVLKQKENTLAGSGEFSLDQGWLGMAKAPFLLHLTASINDLGALAGLFGSPFDEMSGRMSLSGSINGQASKLGGFLTLEGSQMGFRKRPVDSGRVEVSFAGSEAQVTQCEFWSGEDFVRAKGNLEINAPHTYWGEIQARTKDFSAYRDFFKGLRTPEVRAGAVQVRWQGDGNASAHSGAFNVSLENFISEFTPSGVTGRFAGTYSPENVYFSGFELERGSLRFTTRATLAKSGIKLDDARLRASGRQLAAAEMYLPIDPFEVGAGKPLTNALHLDKKLYAEVVANTPLSIRELLRLAGNDRPFEGTLKANLRADGPITDLSIDANAEAKGLSRRFGDGMSPPSQIRASVHGAGGSGTITGELTSAGVSPITFKADGPFGVVSVQDGTRRWIDPEGRISAELNVPRADLAVLRPLVPSIRQLAGLLSGDISVTGTVSSPSLHGRLALSDGQFEISPYLPVISKATGGLIITDGRAELEEFTGELGAGSFEVWGGLSLKDVFDPQFDFFFTGTRIDLARVAWLQLKANATLHASGDFRAGLVKGDVRLLDGRFSRRLEVIPISVVSASDDDSFRAPRFNGVFPRPFNRWRLEVSLTNDSSFLFSGTPPAGEILAELRLTGTLDYPLLLGQIKLKDVRAFLPFTTLTIPDAYVEFVEESPWVPRLDIHGMARALDYDVQLYAFGPLDEPRLILRSDPSLPQGSLIQLLTTGMVPGVYAQAPVVGPHATNGLVAPGVFTRKPSSGGGRDDFARNDFQLSPSSAYPGRATQHRRFELWRGLSLLDENDELTPANDRVTFRLRLR
jgi:TamB, inner membrane protein subunit of TAM complex